MSNPIQVDVMLASMGRTYADLLEQGRIPRTRLKKIFPEDDEAYLQIEAGLSYSFDAATQVLHAIIVSVMQRNIPLEVFQGELSEPYRRRNRKDVLAAWGEPEQSRDSSMMPKMLGKVGGWDVYNLASKGFPDIELTYQYTADLDVSGIVFNVKASQEAP